MIPYVDTAMVGFFKVLFLNDFVVWAPPEVSRQRLARAGDEDGQGKIGVPGLSIFRTGEQKAAYNNKSATWESGGTDLLPRLQAGPNTGKYQVISYVYVNLQYEVIVWAKHLSDLNRIERKLWFAEDYKPVPVRIPFVDPNTGEQIVDANGSPKVDDLGQPLYNEFPLKLWADSGVEYSRLNDEKTGKTLFYSLKRTYQIDAPWFLDHIDPVIEEIVIHYKILSTKVEVPYSGDEVQVLLLPDVHKLTFDEDSLLIE